MVRQVQIYRDIEGASARLGTENCSRNGHCFPPVTLTYLTDLGHCRKQLAVALFEGSTASHYHCHQHRSRLAGSLTRSATRLEEFQCSIKARPVAVSPCQFGSTFTCSPFECNARSGAPDWDQLSFVLLFWKSGTCTKVNTNCIVICLLKRFSNVSFLSLFAINQA